MPLATLESAIGNKNQHHVYTCFLIVLEAASPRRVVGRLLVPKTALVGLQLPPPSPPCPHVVPFCPCLLLPLKAPLRLHGFI